MKEGAEKMKYQNLNRTLYAIGISGITIVVGFWLGFLLFNLVMM